MKKTILIILIIMALIVSGCDTNSKIINQAKQNSEVKAFLEDYPDATITLKYLSEEKVREKIEDINTICEKEMIVKPYYYLKVEHTNVIKLNVFIEDNADEPECVSAKGEYFEEILDPSNQILDPDLILRERKICDEATEIPSNFAETCLEMENCEQFLEPDVCLQRATDKCNNMDAKEICQKDLTTVRNAIEYAGSDNPTIEEKIEVWCPKLYNPDLREGCSMFLENYNNYIEWFDEYYGITITEAEIDLYYMEMAFRDRSFCAYINNPEIRVNCPIWITEYNSYDEWYDYYFENILEPSNP
jgi:hypothetical protein